MYGSRARLMLTGSAPVPPRLVTLFHQLGAPLFEVYGSTEIGWISFNLPHRYRLGTAGRPVDGVVVTLTDEGEIVVRAERPQALGYVFDGTETAASVFLPDGAIATGDLGRWERGYLRLVGRKKNVIITRSGVKINPEELEHDVEQSCAVKKAVVVPTAAGTTLACVVWVDGWDDPERARAVEACVGSGNDKRPASHRISQVVVRPADELSVESGLLTRNLKVDRDAVVRTVFPDTARSAR